MRKKFREEPGNGNSSAPAVKDTSSWRVNGRVRRAKGAASRESVAVTSRRKTEAGSRATPGRRTAQDTPREDESNYLRLFHQMADAVFVIDAKTLRFLDCNLAACQTYGYSRPQMLRMTPLDLHPQEEKDLASRRLRAKKWAVREYHHVTNNGRRLTVEI